MHDGPLGRVGETVSWWILPTTADIGLRAFSMAAQDAILEATMGLQSIQLSENGAAALATLPRSTGEWVVQAPGGDLERGMVLWLEEVLYRGSAEGQWLVEAAIRIDGGGRIEAQASWVDSDLVEREVEVKAVTLHQLALREVAAGEMVPGIEPDIPAFEGPGWMAQVIFDI
ncbi:MAG TPA: hypothetical protein EYM62_04840 [Candidatus Poseidoniales archaeon]|nr:hypothetical protein [Candidatus Poseidoniales archaeon]HIM93238.1 hypothetical protein [Candidatus Poseidoniales archaeon]